MTKRVLLLSSVFIVLIFGISNLFAEKIVFSADQWPPFNMEPGSEKPGYMVEIAKNIFESNGYEVEYKVMPWTRAILECRKGNINGIFAPYKEDAPDFVFPKEPAGEYGFQFFTRAEDDWEYKGVESLYSVVLGSIKDYAYSPEIDKYIQEENGTTKVDVMYGTAPLETNIKKLLGGRLDVVIATGPVFRYKVKTMGHADKVRSAGTAVEAKDCYIAFSPALSVSDELSKLYTTEIQKMRESGELKKILEKYGLTDWK